MVRIKHFKAYQTMLNFRIVQTGLMKEIPRNKTQHAACRHRNTMNCQTFDCFGLLNALSTLSNRPPILKQG